MRYRILGKTGLSVSEIGLGTSKGLVERLPREEGERLVARALDRGVNFIDTARLYGDGEAEARIGAAIRGRRDAVILCTKGGFFPRGGGRSYARERLLASLDESLEKLGTDYVDIFMLHIAGRAELRPGSEAIAALGTMRDQGRARFIGASVDRDCLWPALDAGAFDVLEVSYHIAELVPEEGFLAAANGAGVGIVVKEPLAVTNFLRPEPSAPWAELIWRRLRHYGETLGGAGMPPAELALRFVLSSPLVHTAIPATANLAHLEENLAVSDGRGLSPELQRRVRECYARAVKAEG